MKTDKFTKGLVCVALILGLAYYLNPKTKDEPLDIQEFTTLYESEADTPVVLNDPQKATVEQIISSFETFLEEKQSNNYKTVLFSVQKYNWALPPIPTAEDNVLNVRLQDGSNVSLNFENDLKSGIHQVSIFNLNEAQCKFIENYYKYNKNTSTEIINNDDEETDDDADLSCSDLTNEENDHLALRIAHGSSILGREYPFFAEEISDLVNKKYAKVIGTYGTNIYFTKKEPSFKFFYDSVDYMVNPKNSHVIVGALNQEGCKSLIYNLPNGIKYTINGKNQCEAGLNQIEFFKQG